LKSKYESDEFYGIGSENYDLIEDQSDKIYAKEAPAKQKIKAETRFTLFLIIAQIVSISFVPILAVLLICGESFKTMHEYYVMKKKCDVALRGTIVEFTESVSDFDEHETVYRPVFSYEYHGQEYRYQPDDMNMGDESSLGRKYTIMINSDDPYSPYIPPSKSEIRYSKSFIKAGAIIYLIIGTGVVLLIIRSVRRKKCLKQDNA